jgi:putative ABC transport system permease protein
MEKLFGVPIDTFMIVLVGLLALGLLVLAVIALRDRVVFKMAVRNIPRRKAQSTLIIVGLMLATLLFSASFSTGDTMTHSIRLSALEDIGSVDEVVIPTDRDAAGRLPYFSDEQAAVVARTGARSRGGVGSQRAGGRPSGPTA